MVTVNVSDSDVLDSFRHFHEIKFMMFYKVPSFLFLMLSWTLWHQQGFTFHAKQSLTC